MGNKICHIYPVSDHMIKMNKFLKRKKKKPTTHHILESQSAPDNLDLRYNPGFG